MPCSEDDDSQTGFLPESRGMSKAELRKTNKPIMEKKRRARINQCLNELKDLLVDPANTDPARHSKLEKADILELTVKHLQRLQRAQLAAAAARDPAVLARFRAGFGDCALEVRRYLSRLACAPAGLRTRLGTHLNTCISGIERHQDHPLLPDPLRLDDERPSAFHFVKSTKPTSPPLSPLSCDSACDSSTELETPPRPIQTFPFPTPPSRSASDQDSSPETQKPTVSSTTISPETLKQEALRKRKYMEPLSIIIDVENYKIGIDASPKRAVDYSMRNKLKRPVVEPMGPAPKISKLETILSDKDEVTLVRTSPERSAFRRVPEKSSVYSERRLTIPESIPSVIERPSLDSRIVIHPEESRIVIHPEESRIVIHPEMPLQMPRTVISHTAESLAQSSRGTKGPDADTRSRSPEQGVSNNSEMWRPW